MKIEFSRAGASGANAVAALAIAISMLERLSAPDQEEILQRAAAYLAGYDRVNRKEAHRMLTEMLKQY